MAAVQEVLCAGIFLLLSGVSGSNGKGGRGRHSRSDRNREQPETLPL